MTKDYARASIRSWIGDECPAVSIGALINQQIHMLALEQEVDALALRKQLLQFFCQTGLNAYMRKLIIIATQPRPHTGFIHHRVFVIIDGYDH